MIDMDKIEKIPIPEDVKRVLDNVSHILIGLNYKETARAYKQAVEKLISLSEEPDKSLEEAAEEHYDEMWDELGGFAETRDGCYDIFFPSKAIRDTFIAGAEWQASQMPMPEDTVLFNKGVAEGRRLEREDMLKDAVEVEGVVIDNGSGGTIIDTQCGVLYLPPLVYAAGEKVRMVVLKAEEEYGKELQ